MMATPIHHAATAFLIASMISTDRLHSRAGPSASYGDRHEPASHVPKLGAKIKRAKIKAARKQRNRT